MVITPTNFQKSVASALCAARAADTPVGTYGKDGRLYIYVNDRFAIRCKTTGSFQKPFSFITTAGELRKVLAIPGNISFEMSDASPIVSFIWGQNELKIRTIEKEMPEMRKPAADAVSFTIPSAIIKQMCRDTLWVNEGNESFPNVRLKMEAKGGVGKLTVYAVDSKTILKRQENFETNDPDFESIVDINAAHLKTLLSTIDSENMNITISDGILFLSTESMLIDAKYIVGEHVVPDAEKILSIRDAKYSTVFDKSEMLEKLKLASVFSGEGKNARVVLSFFKSETRVKAMAQDGIAGDMQVLSELSNDNACGTRAAFSINLLDNIIRSYQDDEVKLEFSSSTQPFWLHAEDGGEEDKSEMLACFMPLKI